MSIVHNEALIDLMKSQYTVDDIKHLHAFLQNRGVLHFEALKNGFFPAANQANLVCVLKAMEQGLQGQEPSVKYTGMKQYAAAFTIGSMRRFRRAPEVLDMLGYNVAEQLIEKDEPESFFHVLKTELARHQTYQIRDGVKKAIFEYIEVFRNRARLYYANGYLSPVDYELQYKAA
jgi:hypothetical protein